MKPGRQHERLTDLNHRWNKAMTKAGFMGSEFIDEPERCADEIRRMKDQIARLVHKLAEARRKENE